MQPPHLIRRRVGFGEHQRVVHAHDLLRLLPPSPCRRISARRLVVIQDVFVLGEQPEQVVIKRHHLRALDNQVPRPQEVVHRLVDIVSGQGFGGGVGGRFPPLPSV